MKNLEPEDYERELKRRRSSRNLVLAALLVGLAILMYAVTIVKLSRQEAKEESTSVVSEMEKE
jgi:hypothetical protein